MKKPTFIISVILLVLLVGVFVLQKIGLKPILAYSFTLPFEYVNLRANEGRLFLPVVSVEEVRARGKGVVKIQMPGGIKAADLVETSHLDASPVRLRTPYGTKAWRRARVFSSVVDYAGGYESGQGLIQTPDGGYLVLDSANIFVKFNYKGEVEWAKHTGGAGALKDFIPTSDGGYAAVGSSNGVSLVKYNSSHNIQWAKKIELAGGGESVAQTTDGGYIVTGSLGSWYTSSIFLLKFSPTGNLEWARTAGEDCGSWCASYPCECGYRGTSVIQTSDGGYVVAGYARARIDDDYATFSGSYGLFLKFDAAGTLLWARRLKQLSPMNYIGIGRIRDGSVVEAGGGYVVAWSFFGKGLLLGKFLSNGGMEWGRRYCLFNDVVINDLAKTADNGFAIAAWGSDHAFWWGGDNLLLLKLDSSGYPGWMRTVGGSQGGNLYGKGVVQTSDGGYAVTGYTWSMFPKQNLLLLKGLHDGYTCGWGLWEGLGGCSAKFDVSTLSPVTSTLSLAQSNLTASVSSVSPRQAFLGCTSNTFCKEVYDKYNRPYCKTY